MDERLPRQWCFYDIALPAVKVTLTDAKGSTPRQAGSFMLVDHQQNLYGTIGGGALEYHAIKQAVKIMQNNDTPSFYRQHEKMPLGPNLGQCCGGMVELLFEKITAQEQQAYQNFINTDGLNAINIPYASGEIISADNLQQPYFAMDIVCGTMPLYLYGAGHVARALVYHLQKFDFTIHWADINADRFPTLEDSALQQHQLINPDLGLVADYAVPHATHLIMTHDHALDLHIIDRLLTGNQFKFLGLIGSRTKYQHFVKRLKNLGHTPENIARIICPVGIDTVKKKLRMGLRLRLLQKSLMWKTT